MADFCYSFQINRSNDKPGPGIVVRTFGQFPFGETWYETGTADKWKFTSYERDSESGLDYGQHRYYAPGQGRFTSADPLTGTIPVPQSLNRYAYVINDPANLVDPMGLEHSGVCLNTTPGPNAGNPGPCSAANAMALIDAINFDWMMRVLASFGGGFGGFGSPGGGGGGGGGAANKGTAANSCAGPNPPVPCANAENKGSQQPQQTCYESNSLVDTTVRFFSLVRIPETWREWVVGGGAKLGLFETAKAGAKSAGGEESLGALAIGRAGSYLGLAGTGAMIGATIADGRCQIGGTIRPSQELPSLR